MISTSENLKEHLDKLVSDDTYLKIALGYIPPEQLKLLLNEISGTDLIHWEEFETNGWDHDFWIYFKYKESKLLFSGSWYYGNYSISKAEQ